MDLLTSTIPSLENLSELCIRCRSTHDEEAEDQYLYVAQELASSSTSLQYIKVSDKVWRIYDAGSSALRLEELDEYQAEEIELFSFKSDCWSSIGDEVAE